MRLKIYLELASKSMAVFKPPFKCRVETHHTLVVNAKRYIFLMSLFLTTNVAFAQSEKIDENLKQQADSVNKFAFDFYQELASKDSESNIVFSPVSISTAFAMAYAGARYETAKEIAKVFYFNYPPAHFHDEEKNFIAKLLEVNKSTETELLLANRIWLDKSVPLKDSFKKLMKESYNFDPVPLNFKDNEKSINTINEWIDKKTRSTIKEIIPSNSSLSGIVITNAVYFNAKWLFPFKNKETKDRDFFLINKNKIQTQTMHQNDDFNYTEIGDIQILEMLYKDSQLKEIKGPVSDGMGKYEVEINFGNYSMFIFLPKEMEGIGPLEKKLNPDFIKKAVTQFETYNVDIYLPKFTASNNLDLNGVLQRQGIKQAFTEKADFSGITQDKLFISSIFHKTFIKVNERGTEAGAATALVMLGFKEKKKAIFNADHPFIYIIMNNKTGAILFIGRVMNPQ